MDDVEKRIQFLDISDTMRKILEVYRQQMITRGMIDRHRAATRRFRLSKMRYR
jgi:hypothetical protein